MDSVDAFTDHVDSMAWAKASNPVPATKCPGRVAVNSGSTIEARGDRAEPTREYLIFASSSQTVAVSDISEPDPDVVGMAMTGTASVMRFRRRKDIGKRSVFVQHDRKGLRSC